MRILITGANGYLGFNLTKKLISEGHDVLVISKNTDKLSSILEYCSFIQSYTEDLHLHKQQINEFFPDVVVHFGWWGGNSYVDTNSLNQYHNNIPSNVRFLDLINSLYSRPKFVGIGSFAEYGQVLSTVNETYKEEPINHYGIAKLILKEYSQKFCKQNNLKWVWVRPCFTYGPGDKNTRLIPTLIKKFFNNENIELDECKTQIDYIYIDDFTNLIYQLIISNQEGVYNISSGSHQPLKEVVFKLKDLIQSKSKITFNSNKNRINTQYHVSANNSKILKINNNYKFTSLEEGLTQTINERLSSKKR